MARVQRAVSVPLMAHEGCFSLTDATALIELGAVGVLGVNTERPGGITQALRAIDYASQRGLGTVLHNQPLGIASAAQVTDRRGARAATRPRDGALRPRDARGRSDPRAARLPRRSRARARRARASASRSTRPRSIATRPPRRSCLERSRGRGRGRRSTRGGPIVTLDDAQPHAEALATRGDRIVAVGSEAACRAALGARRLRARRPRRPRAAARLHRHAPAPDHAGLLRSERGPARRAQHRGSCRRRCARAAARVPDGEWLVGLQLQDEDLAEGRLPTRAELDAACSDRPTVVVEHDGHSAVGNTLALAAAGIDGATRRIPPAAASRATRRRAPLGPCFEAAAQQLLGAAPSPALERLRDGARDRSPGSSQFGITSAGVILQTDAEGPAGAAGRLEAHRVAVAARRGSVLDLRDPGRAQRRRGRRGACVAAARSRRRPPRRRLQDLLRRHLRLAAPHACTNRSAIAPASAA